MVFKVKWSTKGFAEYLEALAKAGQDVDRIAGQALRAGGEVLAEGMRQRVAKDTRNLEGHIVCSDVKQDGNRVYVEVGVLDADAETARYGNVQEYGSSSMAAQPYVRPAIDEDMGKAKREMKAVFEREMGNGE